MRLIFVHPIPVPHTFGRLDVFQSPEYRIEFEGDDGVRITHEPTGISFVHKGTGYSYGETRSAPVAAPVVADTPKPKRGKRGSPE